MIGLRRTGSCLMKIQRPKYLVTPLKDSSGVLHSRPKKVASLPMECWAEVMGGGGGDEEECSRYIQTLPLPQKI